MKVGERVEGVTMRRAASASSDRSRPSSPLQRRIDASAVVQRTQAVQGLADRSAVVQRPAGLEGIRDAVGRLSGQDLRDVAIHRDSPEPERKGALALATRDAVHLRPGLEGAAGHELWHVAQQRAGRVHATGTLGDGTAINTDAGLEREADRMGARAHELARSSGPRSTLGSSGVRASAGAGPEIVQGLWTRDEARTQVANKWKSRSDAYTHVLDEFRHWHDYVIGETSAVKREFLQQLIRTIESYVADKAKKTTHDRSANREKTLNGMYMLRDHVMTELAALGGAEPTQERVYVGGGEAAIEEDWLMSGGLGYGVFAGKTRVMPGTADALANLGDGPTIHAFGHGNFGTGIGSKSHKLDPSQLVDGMIADGLPRARPVVLRLFACGTGAASLRGGHYARNSPAFVQRVAERLAARRFQHATVIGYTLFANATAHPDAPLGTGRAIYEEKADIHNDPTNIIPVADREVIWVVRRGRAWQSSGGNWVASNPHGDHYEINPI
ncbi:eCIS core domain-containing protein [Nannocystaceae bacterium ST9]